MTILSNLPEERAVEMTDPWTKENQGVEVADDLVTLGEEEPIVGSARAERISDAQIKEHF